MASSADKLNLTKLSLNSIVEFILDDSNPLHMRAIRLFELQVAIFYPTSFIPLLENASDTRGIDKRLRTTRIFVATKFLQQIENELCKAARTETISIRELAGNADYQTLFDDVIAANGGWSRVRLSISAKTFDRKLAELHEAAAPVAKLIDFSYRFEKLPNRGTRSGGVEAARFVVCTAKSYDFPRRESTIKTLWGRFGPTAIFLYLLLVRKFKLFPPRVSSKFFLDELVSMVNDTALLKEFFFAYQTVWKVLAARNYGMPTLTSDIKSSAPPIEANDFPKDVVDAFEAYKDDGGF